MEKKVVDITDELLNHAESLAKALQKYGHNEMKKAADYFNRHKNEPSAYDRLLNILKLDPPKYSNTVIKDWHSIGKELKEDKNMFTNYTHKQIAFILGWTSRLVRYYNIKKP
jgi:PhoPQ-activated pathogenicity-related protein